jgi:hypothetical protein
MGETDGVDAARDFLYGVALEDFVDERKRIVKALRTANDKAGATEVARLRKPSAAAWALNRVARERPDVVERWLAAAAVLRDVSANPVEVGGAAVREAIAGHREATVRLIDAVRERGAPGDRPLSEAMTDRIRALLQSATTDPATGELLRSGRISDDVTDGQMGPGTVADEAPSPSPRRPRQSRRAGSEASARAAAQVRGDRARERAERAAQLERRIGEAEAEVAGIKTEQMRRLAAAEKAADRAEGARRSLRRAESEADAAHEAARELEEPLRAAERDLERLRADLPEGS